MSDITIQLNTSEDRPEASLVLECLEAAIKDKGSGVARLAIPIQDKIITAINQPSETQLNLSDLGNSE